MTVELAACHIPREDKRTIRWVEKIVMYCWLTVVLVFWETSHNVTEEEYFLSGVIWLVFRNARTRLRLLHL